MVADLVEEDENEANGKDVDGQKQEQSVAGGRLSMGTGLAGLSSVAPAFAEFCP